MTVERDENGRFVKGGSGNPKGRPQMEMSVSALIDAAVTVDDWKAIVRKLLDRARRGDLKAIEMLLDRRFGKPTQKSELTGADGGALVTVIEVIKERTDG